MSRTEAGFVRRVQACWTRKIREGITEADLLILGGYDQAQVTYLYWKIIPLWAKSPKDDFYFWLHVAWELGCRKMAWPEFMDDITNLELIEPAMEQWERDKEIERWKLRFQTLEGAPRLSPAERLELRLAIFPEEARLQWRLVAFGVFVVF